MLGFRPIAGLPIAGTVPAAAGAGVTLPANAGVFAVTGAAADTEFGRVVLTLSGSFTINGQPADLEFGREVAADAASFAVTGAAADTEFGREVAPNAGSFSITGADATLVYDNVTGFTIAADAGSFTINGQPADLEFGREVLALAGSFTITGAAADLEFGREVAPNAGSFAVTGAVANLERGREVVPNAGSFAITGAAATLVYARQFELEAAPGAFVITGTPAGTINSGDLLKPAAPSYGYWAKTKKRKPKAPTHPAPVEANEVVIDEAYLRQIELEKAAALELARRKAALQRAEEPRPPKAATRTARLEPRQEAPPQEFYYTGLKKLGVRVEPEAPAPKKQTIKVPVREEVQPPAPLRRRVTLNTRPSTPQAVADVYYTGIRKLGVRAAPEPLMPRRKIVTLRKAASHAAQLGL
jgi:hypothetical protein